MYSAAAVPTTDHRPLHALITGATAGIGAEFAQQLAGRGYDLVLVARDRERLDATATRLREHYGVSVETLAADLGDRTDLDRVAARVSAPDRPIDLLVNNAGFGLKEKFTANEVEAEQAMLDVLVVAVMRLSHAALRVMAERGSGGVINVSSIAGFLPRGTYSAAKAWVNSFGEWAAAEYAGSGVTVTTLCPGFTRTEFHQRMGVSRASAPGFLWLDVERLVQEALTDHENAKAFSVPGKRYKTIVAAAKLIPSALSIRLQGLGRR